MAPERGEPRGAAYQAALSDSAYCRAFLQEVELLYRAAFEPDTIPARAMTQEAIAMMSVRPERYFAGADAAYASLEDLFLNLEGIAKWTRFKLH